MLTWRLHFLTYVLLLVASVFAAGSSKADLTPYNGSEVAPNIAIISVEDAGISVELEIYVHDIDVFVDIIPAEWAGGAEHFNLSDQERIDRFGQEVFPVLDAEGTPLPLSVTLVEPRMRVDRASPLAGETDPFSGQVIPAPPEDPRVIFARLFYTFGDVRPEQVTFVPPQSNEEPAAAIGMQVTDRSVPVTEFRYLSKPATLMIDWVDPWHSKFSSPSLNRRSQDGTMSFLYVDPREVRHEILIRLRELAPWIDGAFAVGEMLDSERQAAMLEIGMETLKHRNTVSIEGVPMTPQMVRASFLTLSEQGLQVAEEEKNLNVDNTFLGLILSYPHADLPSEVSIDWDMFDGQISKVPVTLTDAAGPFFDQASGATPGVTWTNHLKTYVTPEVQQVPANGLLWLSPISVLIVVIAVAALIFALVIRTTAVRLSLIVAGVMGLSGAYVLRDHAAVAFVNPLAKVTGTELVQGALSNLLSNVYIAALEVTPEDRGVALRPIVSPVSFDDLAAELEGNLTIRVAGGERARVASVADVSLQEDGITARGVYSGLVTWSVNAGAGHWGHDHRRRVDYRAQVEIIPEDGQWKLAGLTVLEARSPDM